MTGGSGNNQLIVNDSADTKSRTGILTANTITGLGIGGFGVAYTNLANNQTNPPFTLPNAPFAQNLEIELGKGSDVFSIQGTNAATKSLVVNTGAQQDQLYVGSASPSIIRSTASRALWTISRAP